MENQSAVPNIDPQPQVQPELPKPAYNPLLDNVNEKPYSTAGISVSPEQLAGGIPEPIYMPQAIGSRQNPYQQIKDGGTMSGGGSAPSQERSAINPSMNEIPDAEKKEGAKYLAKMIIDGYEQIHGFANMGLQFSPSKLRRLEAEGEIDLSIPVPDGYGNTLTAGGFIQEFNEQSKDALTVSPQFKKEVTPVLERVLAKRGAGLTDEQMLLYMFGKDIAVKGVIFYQMKKSMTDMIDVIREQTSAYKSGGFTAPKPKATPDEGVTKTPYAYAPEQPAPAPMSPQPDPSDPMYNFSNNEVVMESSVQRSVVPKTGRDRIIAQRAKEKKWKADAENASKGQSDYEKAMAERKTGKRGRAKKSISDYVKGVDKEEITKSIILTESNPTEETKPTEE